MRSVDITRFFFTSNLTFKGQVTIPVEIRRMLGLKRGDKVAFIQNGETVIIKPAQSIAERTAGMLAGYRRESPLPPAEERAATELAWAEDVASRPED